jgi:hypothetical protein
MTTPARDLPPLWTCPRCGQRYAGRNMWHSCEVVPLETHLAGKPRAAELFAAFRAAVEEHGPVTVISTKSRFGFMRRVRFAGVVRAKRDSLRIGFWLKRNVESPRFLRVQHLAGDDWIYELELRAESDLDAELRGWLAEAFRVGDQEHLRRR